MRRTFAVVVIVCGLAALAFAIAVAMWGTPDPGSRDGRNPSVLLYGGIGGALTISLTALALLGWSSSVLARLKAISAANPSALVFVAQKTSTTDREMRSLTRNAATSLPSLIVVGLGRDEIGIWGRDKGHPAAVLRRGQVRGARVVDIFNGRALPAIELEIETGSADGAKFTFVPTRKNWEIMPSVDRALTVELAERFVV